MVKASIVLGIFEPDKVLSLDVIYKTLIHTDDPDEIFAAKHSIRGALTKYCKDDSLIRVAPAKYKLKVE